jgi:hypothetical protein
MRLCQIAPNHFSGAVADCTPEIIEMVQDVLGRDSSAAPFTGH